MTKRKVRQKKIKFFTPYFFYFLFVLIAFLSVLSLDYIAWEQGKKSYLFSYFLKDKKFTKEQEKLNQILQVFFNQHNISSSSISIIKDNQGVFHFKMNLTIEKFNLIKEDLEKELAKRRAVIFEEKREKRGEVFFNLWKIRIGQRPSHILLFLSQISPLKARSKVTLIIDDIGHSLEIVDQIISLNVPLTISIIPFLSYSQQAARIAHLNDIEIMLHLPLEPMNPYNFSSEKELITTQMTPEEIENTLSECIRNIPYLQGVNNHMGSKVTKEPEIMKIILTSLKRKNFFFIDSRTTDQTIGYLLAKQLGVLTAARDIFLDKAENQNQFSEGDTEYTKEKFIQLLELAQKEGKAVGIAHPYPQTIQAIKESLPLIKKYNVELVYASKIVN
ncbi:MAG: divergent polysaccharide deacetylase family protein [Candidatus Aminicenantia bacterium]